MSERQTAIVTGGGSGIGLATAQQLAAAGYAVAIVGRTLATLEKAAHALRATGATVLAVRADCSAEQDVAEMVRRVLSEWGRIDVLVNNAGAAPGSPLAEMSLAQWQSILAINLTATFLCTRAVWPTMKVQHQRSLADKKSAAQGGVIVNISSMASKDPFPGLAAYGAAKCGVNMLTLMTAREGAADGIRAHGIAPGGVDTQMLRNLIGETNVRPEQLLTPDDVAAAVMQAIRGALTFAAGETIYLNKHVH